MPPRKPKPKNLVILILDVGQNVNEFEKIKACAFNIYKGKLFKEKSLDEVALIILGSEESENSQNVENICLAVNPSVPSWSNLKAIYNLKQSNTTSDWLSGIKVALDLVEQTSVGQSYDKIGFVVMSNFETNVDKDGLKSIVQSLQQYSIDVILIGPSGDTLSKQYPESYDCLHKLQSTISVEIQSVDKCIAETKFTPIEIKNSMAWNVTFSLGDTVIPITGYKWVGSEYGNIWNIVKDNEHVSSTKIYRQDNQPDQEPLEENDLVRGYHYGNTIIPMTDVESKAMKYESGERGLQLLCFTRKKNIPVYLLEENTVYVITGSEKSADNSLFTSLVKELIASNSVAIVRQVYNKNSSVAIQVLYPYMETVDDDEDEECDNEQNKYYFAMVHLPFAQQMNQIKVPELMTFSRYFNHTKDELSQPELNSMENYIRSLDLAKGAQFEEDIPYLPEVTRDPSTQVLQYFQIKKYMNPKEDLITDNTTEIPEDIKLIYQQSTKVHEAGELLKENINHILVEMQTGDGDEIKKEVKQESG